MSETKKTYPMKLKCANCYKQFIYKFPMGYEVEEKGFGYYHSIPKPENRYDNVKCPYCGCSNITKIGYTEEEPQNLINHTFSEDKIDNRKIND